MDRELKLHHLDFLKYVLHFVLSETNLISISDASVNKENTWYSAECLYKASKLQILSNLSETGDTDSSDNNTLDLTFILSKIILDPYQGIVI